LKKAAPTNLLPTVRNPVKLDVFKEKGLIIRQADYNYNGTLVEAFRGVE
jgi:NAD(P)H dehydrogenase (quinone)